MYTVAVEIKVEGHMKWCITFLILVDLPWYIKRNSKRLKLISMHVSTKNIKNLIFLKCILNYFHFPFKTSKKYCSLGRSCK